jgi:hypothetical protein
MVRAKKPPHEHKPKGGRIPMMVRQTRAAAMDPPNAPGVENLGVRLKWARERKGLNLRAFAKVGMTAEALGVHERQETQKGLPISTAVELAKLLGLRFEWFCLGKGEPFLDPVAEYKAINEARKQAAAKDSAAS